MYEIGFIGFGEAASMFSKGLSVNGNVIIYAYDVNAKHEVFEPNIVRKAKENNVFLVNSLKSLVKKAKVIINLTSATYALQIAEDIVTHLDRKHLYIDMNSSSPMLQNKIHEVISRNALFVDGAVMESIPSYLHKVPINLSGPGA